MFKILTTFISRFKNVLMMRLDIINQRTKLPDRLLVTPKVGPWYKKPTIPNK